MQTMQTTSCSATVVPSSGCLAPTNGRVCTEECNAAPHVVQFFIDTDLPCCATDKWKKTPAVDNTLAEHWCTLQNHFAIGGVKTKMSRHPWCAKHAAPLPQFPTMRGHPRTMAYRKLPVGTRSVAPQCLMQHLMPCTLQCGLSRTFSNEGQNKKQKRGKAHSHLEGRRLHSVGGLATNMTFTNLEEYVLLCENARHCENKHKQARGLTWCEQCVDCCVSSCPKNNKHASPRRSCFCRAQRVCGHNSQIQ